MKRTYGLPLDFFNKLQRALARESDRGQLLLAGIAIELFLKAKFPNQGMKPVSLFAMLKHAREVNWIEADVFHDAEIIRKLGNRCAHEGTRIELDAENIRSALEQFRVPHRRYYDWGKMRAASTPKGLVLYTGEFLECRSEERPLMPLTWRRPVEAHVGDVEQ